MPEENIITEESAVQRFTSKMDNFILEYKSQMYALKERNDALQENWNGESQQKYSQAMDFYYALMITVEDMCEQIHMNVEKSNTSMKITDRILSESIKKETE